MEENIRKTVQGGSVTVEAVFILSFAVACLLFCIYGCLYFHDKAVLEEVSYLVAQKGYLWMTENQNVSGEADWERYSEKSLLWRLEKKSGSEELEEYMKELLEGKLIVCEAPQIEITVKTDEVTVTYCADTTLKGFYPLGDLIVIPQIKGQAVRKGFEAEEFIRLMKALKEEKEEEKEEED